MPVGPPPRPVAGSTAPPRLAKFDRLREPDAFAPRLVRFAASVKTALPHCRKGRTWCISSFNNTERRLSRGENGQFHRKTRTAAPQPSGGGMLSERQKCRRFRPGCRSFVVGGLHGVASNLCELAETDQTDGLRFAPEAAYLLVPGRSPLRPPPECEVPLGALGGADERRRQYLRHPGASCGGVHLERSAPALRRGPVRDRPRPGQQTRVAPQPSTETTPTTGSQQRR